MNTAAVRARLLALRAEVTEEIDTLLEVIDDVDAGPSGPWRTMQEYADYAGVSYDTVRNFIRKGMPRAGRGKLTRIHIEEADAWRRNQ